MSAPKASRSAGGIATAPICRNSSADLGPNLSVTGSLATILWLIALKREGETCSAESGAQAPGCGGQSLGENPKAAED
jgi:hypothetical protein